MAERRILYLTVLLASLVFFWAYREWISWLLLVVLVWLPWLSLLLSLRAMLRLNLRIACPEWVLQEQYAQLTLMGSCDLPHPGVRGRMRGVNLMTGCSIVARSGDTMPTDHCAAWRFSVEKGRVYDYLGLFSHRLRKTTGATVYVLPMELSMATPPDLTRYLATAFKPKPGGGYAENHELRLYRPGDNLHQIHWKLTAKTGKLILREPMEPIRGKAVVSLELNGSEDLVDRKLGRLLWLGRYLLEENVPHEIHCLSGDGVKVFEISSPEGASKAMQAILRLPLAEEGAKIDYIPAAWRHHIGGDAL